MPRNVPMRWCKRCCEPDTRPTCVFDDEGICRPCGYAETYSQIDWVERRKTLDQIIAWAKKNNPSGYDCVIGVSGGKDSTRQALFAKEVGLNPLLVSYAYPPEQLVERGAQNLANLVTLGFDAITVAPAPQTSKALMRYCFVNYGNLFNASELALYASTPKIAIAYRIPLILLGENPALSWGTAAGGSLDHRGNLIRHTNTLQGGDYRRFVPQGMEAKDVYWYRYPTDHELERGNLQIVYIGYFIADFNDHSNSRIAIENGLRVREGEIRDGFAGGLRGHPCRLNQSGGRNLLCEEIRRKNSGSLYKARCRLHGNERSRILANCGKISKYGHMGKGPSRRVEA